MTVTFVKKASFGTEPHLLHKTESPDTSVEAAHAVDTTKLEEMVYQAVVSFGVNGCISDDILKKHTGFPYSSITARYAALERKKFIYYKGDKRKGMSGRNQRVIRASMFRNSDK